LEPFQKLLEPSHGFFRPFQEFLGTLKKLLEPLKKLPERFKKFLRASEKLIERSKKLPKRPEKFPSAVRQRSQRLKNFSATLPDLPVCGLAFFQPSRKISGMLRIENITSLDQPELAPYRTLKRSAEHAKLGIFVTEGDKVVCRLLESPFAVVSVLLPAERLAEFEPRLRARPEKEIAVYVCDKHLLRGLVGFEIYQGVLAIGKIPTAWTLEKILAASPRPRFFAAMDGLGNAENIGVLMRNCAAFGVQALVVGETCSSPFLRRAVRNSMGAVFKLPILQLNNRQGEFGESGIQTERRRDAPVETLAKTLRELRAHGVRCIAAHPHTDKKVLSHTDFTGDCCVVFGSEGHGVSEAVLAACDEAVAIPMANDIDSLNVGNAAAVFLYEVNRQRSK
jgi:tRNA G18 (ribose-2'-O)-methylase SpoU